MRIKTLVPPMVVLDSAWILRFDRLFKPFLQVHLETISALALLMDINAKELETKMREQNEKEWEN